MKQVMDKDELLKASLEKIRQLKQELSKSSNQAREPVAVIGLACDFPAGTEKAEDLWQKLLAGQSLLGQCPEYRLEDYRDNEGFLERIGLQAGWLEQAGGFDAGFFRFSAEEALRTDPQQRIFLQTAWHALEDAGIDPEGLKGSDCGVFTGVYAADYEKRLYGYRDLSVCQGRDVMSAGQSFIAGRLSYFLGLHGPSLAVDSACSSSLVAIDAAVQNLRSGRCELAIAGGVNLLGDAELTVAMAKAGMLSPEQCCRPFDINARGIVRGEGCGVVILKSLKKALADGDPIRAVIQGTAVTQDGASSGPTVPYGPAQEMLLRQALQDADLSADQVGYVEAHGTGTPLGDPIELEALANVYTDSHSDSHPLFIGSVKGNLGHLEAASGMAGLIKTILMIEQQTLLPSINFTEGNTAVDWQDLPIRVVTQPEPWHKRPYAGISSFGLSGTNAHVIAGPAPQQNAPQTQTDDGAPSLNESSCPASDPADNKYVIPLSARTLTQLKEMAKTLADCQQGELAQWQKTLIQGRAEFSHRLAWYGSQKADLTSALSAFADGRLTDGLIYRNSPQAVEVDFLFTGQGSQYWQMGLSWYSNLPVFKSAFDQCAAYFQKHFDESLHAILFEDAGADLIDQTRYAQPALFALQYAQAQQWQAFGIRPAAVLGHSVGEFAAAVIAGVMTLDEAIYLVGWRGRLMQSMPGDGGMLAIRAPAEQVQALICESDTAQTGELVISVYNGPQQQVVSGPEYQLKYLIAKLEEASVSHQLLTVSHAFHSPQMEPVLAKFTAIVQEVDYQQAQLPFYSSVTGELLASDGIDANYWLKHIIAPVQYDKAFSDLVSSDTETLSSLSQSDSRLAIELGPRPVLSGLAAAHPLSAARIWLSSLQADGQLTALTEAMPQLYCHGLPVKAIDDALLKSDKCHLPGYPFRRQHYWLPLPDTAASDSVQTVSLPEDEDDADQALIQDVLEVDDWLAFVTDDVCQALGIAEGDPIPSANDNLLQWGVDSILLLRLIQRWHRTTLRQLKIAQALAEPTLQAWSLALSESDPQQHEALQVTASDQPDTVYPLTPVQRAYWAGRRNDMPLGGVACYLYQELAGQPTDHDRLEKAFNQLIQRHDALRSRFLADGLQEVLPELPYQSIPCHDLRQMDENQAQAALAEIRQRLSHHVADCMQPPLLVIEIVLMPDNQQHFCFGIDFLIADAFSLHLFWKELSELYVSPDTTLPAINLHFSDYIKALEQWQNSQSWQAARNYWLNRTDTLPSAPELPFAQSPDNLSGHRFKRLEHTLSRDQWQSIRTSAAELGITPSVSVLAVYAQVLERWSASQRFSLTLTLFNRLPVHDDIHSLIADFTSLILFEVDTTDCHYVSLASRLQHQLATDLQHRDFSAIDLLDAARKQGREVSSPVVFTSTLGVGGETLFDTDAFGQPVYGVSQTPQVWLDLQIYEQQGELLLCWDYAEALFPENMMEDMFAAMTARLTRLAEQQAGQWPTNGTLTLPEHQLAVRHQINATEQHLATGLLHQGFWQQCSIQPDQIALLFHDQSWSYRQLQRWSGQIIHQLQQEAITPEERVAIIMPKHPAQIAACLAILGCGAVFVPVDASQPASRQNQLLAQAQCRLALTLATQPELSDACQQILVSEEALADCPEVSPNMDYRAEQLAYIIFTSGSTGTPKGVMISYHSASNTVLDINQRFEVTADDRVIAISALHFDLSIYDIFGLLTAGGTLILVDDDDHYEPDSWYLLCQRYRVTIWNSVPQLLDLLVDFCESKALAVPESLRLAMVSGDWVPVTLPDRGKACDARYQLVALGGATEASIWSNYYCVQSCPDHWRSIPYGFPLANQSYCVLDDNLTDCPDWVRGDLFIMGEGLAQGYLDDPEKTAASFIQHPVTGVRLYRTGDKARYWPDGMLEFLGRDDQQVKINGYRVELGEIENKLALHPDVARAVVIVGEQRQLLGFVLATDSASSADGASEADQHLMSQRYKSWLLDHVPSYMVPAQIICLDKLPLTTNGKVDRGVLLKQAQRHENAQPDVNTALNADSTYDSIAVQNSALLTEGSTGTAVTEDSVACQIITLLEQRLSISPIKITDNLIRLGASSIDMIRLANDLEKVFGQRPKINELTRLESVSALIELYQTVVPENRTHAQLRGWQSYLQQTPLLDDVDARALYKKSGYQLRHDLDNTIELPDLPLDTPLFEQRRSRRKFLQQPLFLNQFTALLNRLRPGISGRHSYASAGAAYPVQAYFYLADNAVEGLSQGLYYYQPHRHKLCLIEDCELNLTEFSMSCRTWQSHIGFACFLVAELKAIAPLYGPSAREFSLIEAGSICQMLESTCYDLGIGLCQVGDFDFDRIADRMAMSDSHMYLHTLMGGTADPDEHSNEAQDTEELEGGEL